MGSIRGKQLPLDGNSESVVLRLYALGKIVTLQSYVAELVNCLFKSYAVRQQLDWTVLCLARAFTEIAVPDLHSMKDCYVFTAEF